MPISQPAVSQHLKTLREASLVTSVPDGARQIYRVDPTGVSELRTWVDTLWDDVLDNFSEAANKEHDR